MSFNDWNNNGSHDSFDSYVDYKISSESSSNHSGGSANGSSNSNNYKNSNNNPQGRSNGETILLSIVSIGLSLSAMYSMVCFGVPGLFIAAGLLYGAYKIIT